MACILMSFVTGEPRWFARRKVNITRYPAVESRMAPYPTPPPTTPSLACNNHFSLRSVQRFGIASQRAAGHA